MGKKRYDEPEEDYQDEYYEDEEYNDEEEYDEEDRAYFRHQRRTRTTAIVWAVTGILILAILGGIVFGVLKVMDAVSSKSEANQLKQQLQELEAQNEATDAVMEIETPED